MLTAELKFLKILQLRQKDCIKGQCVKCLHKGKARLMPLIADEGRMSKYTWNTGLG